MVTSHIECGLILVALPMTGMYNQPLVVPSSFDVHPADDIENQKALQLARRVDPEGCRTIGKSPLLHCFSACCKLMLARRRYNETRYVAVKFD
jgi:hypothetical protein